MWTMTKSGWARVLVMVAMIWLLPAPGVAGGRCTDTAKALFRACGLSVQDDWWVASAKCINVSDAGERQDCYGEAGQERRESSEVCEDQLDTRLAACGVLGEGRYDPALDPADFDTSFAHPAHPNPYFPIAIGNHWEFRSASETNTLEILDQTKLINGVTCVVQRDQVFKDGALKENTDDWFAQAKDGTVWYCGEEVKDYQSFDGDQPKLPELVSIDGSFKAGRDRDKPGIIFLTSPAVDDAYLEEFSLGNAEDVTEILSTSYSFGHDAELDEVVPAVLANALCHGDCVVTKNYSLLEPGIFARKYYARGIGVFLEIEPDEGNVIRLVSCNLDPRCATLPQP
ncbi:MAG TPA: hypothetical protein VGV61_14990 [Thermoanaerobaculia bacterium]|nr:hypothetical protein [Thermoanaerobaculia bacterium]